MEPLGLTEAINRLKKSKEYRCDKQGNCNVAIGKVRMCVLTFTADANLQTTSVTGLRQ